MNWQIVSASTRLSVERDLGVLILAHSGKSEIILDLVKEGVHALILGLVDSRGKDNLELTVTTVHRRPNTHAETMIHGLVRDQAQAQIKGLIKIPKGAQQVTDFLTERLLLLSAAARALAEPELEIEADEVRASHAATVSPLDREELFYLMSRGVDQESAEKLITDGFLRFVLNRIDDAKIRQEARAYVKR